MAERVFVQNHNTDCAQLEGQIGKGRIDFRKVLNCCDEGLQLVQHVNWKPRSLQQPWLWPLLRLPP